MASGIAHLRATAAIHTSFSGMGLAIDYALNLWTLLGIYLNDGRIEIGNNLVENAIRPTALGKKNWLFIGQAVAGERSAILYTIVECCRRRGLDPYAYLRHVLTRLPTATNRKLENKTQDGRPLRRYQCRWTVERTIGWLQNYRRLCIRREKSTAMFQGFINLTRSLLLLKEVLG